LYGLTVANQTAVDCIPRFIHDLVGEQKNVDYFLKQENHVGFVCVVQCYRLPPYVGALPCLPSSKCKFRKICLNLSVVMNIETV
jgi:hypothetical protein